MEKGLNFDYLVIPMLLIKGKGITTLDSLVYGVIYGASKLRQQRCFLSNEGIAETIGSTPGAIANSLVRLEEAGAIHRLYNDSARTKRSEIIPLIIFGKTTLKEIEKANKMTSSGSEVTSSGSETGFHQGVKLTSPGDEQSSKYKIEDNSSKNIYEFSSSHEDEDTPIIPRMDSVYQKDEDIPYKELCATIEKFKVLFPMEIESKKAYILKTTKDAVSHLMRLKTGSEIEWLISEYDKYKHEKFIPKATRIKFFCDKVDGIEHYLKTEKHSSHLMKNFKGKENNDKEQQWAAEMRAKVNKKNKK